MSTWLSARYNPKGHQVRGTSDYFWKSILTIAGRMAMTTSVTSKDMLRRFRLGAALIGGVGTIAEAFIAITTLRSGYAFGVYDLGGVACGLLALALIGRYPVLAALLWLGTLPLLYSGRLLVSVACLPVLFLPLLAAGFAMWSWHLSRQAN
jgi:hypothetical protein